MYAFGWYGRPHWLMRIATSVSRWVRGKVVVLGSAQSCDEKFQIHSINFLRVQATRLHLSRQESTGLGNVRGFRMERLSFLGILAN